jgi:uncharacterized protein (UPF0335 family)
MTDLDQLYPRAVYFVTNERKAATSFIQRKLMIGYNTAAALMERMEAEGVVSAADHVGKREILIDPTDAPESAAPTSSPAPAGEGVEGATPTPQPEPQPEPAYTGPTKRFTCDGCDTTATGPVDGLPRGWWTQTSGKIGTLYKCEACAQRNASRIATEHMTTKEILNAGSEGAEVDLIVAAAQSRLKSYISRLQLLREDALAIAADKRDVCAQAKGEGFDTKVILKLLAEMNKDPAKRQGEQTMLELYAAEVGFNL